MTLPIPIIFQYPIVLNEDFRKPDRSFRCLTWLPLSARARLSIAAPSDGNTLKASAEDALGLVTQHRFVHFRAGSAHALRLS